MADVLSGSRVVPWTWAWVWKEETGVDWTGADGTRDVCRDGLVGRTVGVRNETDTFEEND